MNHSKKAAAALFLPSRGRTASPKNPLDVMDNPAFQAIWDVIAMIPRGCVSSYGAVARAAGLPGRARLAGLALKVAPADMHLPWHRVLGAGGRIVFPKTSRHHRDQARLLRAEGVLVTNGRADRAAITDLGER